MTFSLEIEISTNTTLHFSLEVLIAQTVSSASACRKEEWKLEMRNQDNKKKIKSSRQRPVVNMVKISKVLKDRVEKKKVKLDLKTEWDSEGTSEQGTGLGGSLGQSPEYLSQDLSTQGWCVGSGQGTPHR